MFTVQVFRPDALADTFANGIATDAESGEATDEPADVVTAAAVIAADEDATLLIN